LEESESKLTELSEDQDPFKSQLSSKNTLSSNRSSLRNTYSDFNRKISQN